MEYLQNNDNRQDNLYKTAKVKVYGNTLGTVDDVIDTLKSISRAYNLFILFQIALKDHEFVKNNEIFGFKSVMNRYSSILSTSNYTKIISPEELLVISKVNFNSPGFWEIIGSLNPLTQLREYLNDRHNRKKDKLTWESETAKAILDNRRLELENKKLEIENYELELTNQKLALQNIDYSIDISLKKLNLTKEVINVLKDVGYTDSQMREFTNNCINIFTKLEETINNDRITSIEFVKSELEKNISDKTLKEIENNNEKSKEITKNDIE